jgi:hypothetical protein
MYSITKNYSGEIQVNYQNVKCKNVKCKKKQSAAYIHLVVLDY